MSLCAYMGGRLLTMVGGDWLRSSTVPEMMNMCYISVVM